MKSLPLERIPTTAVATRSVLPPWLDRSQYPFTLRTYHHADGSLHYVDEGDGPPLLFVHGTPSWSYEWRGALTTFRNRNRCLALDHLGFGLSAKPKGAAYLPRDHTDRLHAFIRELNLTNITLVVHDFGGPIATPLLVRDPSRFRRVIAVNTWAWNVGADRGAQKLSRFVRSPLGRFLYLRCNASPRWLLPQSFGDKRRLTTQTHHHYLAPFTLSRERYAPWTLGAHLAVDQAYAPELPRVLEGMRSLPCSVIWGRRDHLLGNEPRIRWQNELGTSRVFDLNDSGHFPQEEARVEFLSTLESALADEPNE